MFQSINIRPEEVEDEEDLFQSAIDVSCQKVFHNTPYLHLIHVEPL